MPRRIVSLPALAALMVLFIASGFPVYSSDELGEQPKLERSSATVDRAKVDRAEIKRLIDHLGHDDFAEREAATEQLIKIGLPALEELHQAQDHADREVRFRVRRLLAVVRRMDFHQRLRAFSQDQGGDRDFGLPGWKQFSQRLGRGANARSLFIEMQKSEHETMKAIQSGDPSMLDQVLSSRAADLRLLTGSLQSGSDIGSIATLLFIAGQKGVSVESSTASDIYTLCHQQSVQNALNGGPYRQLTRRLLGQWITRSDRWNMHQAMNLAVQFKLKEGLDIAMRLLEKKNSATYDRQYAVRTIVALGNRSHVEMLEKLLDDKTVVNKITVKQAVYTSQVCDVALAGLIYLTGQNVQDYGFERLNASPEAFIPSMASFVSENQRKLAMEKWQNYRAQMNEGNKVISQVGEPTGNHG